MTIDRGKLNAERAILIDAANIAEQDEADCGEAGLFDDAERAHQAATWMRDKAAEITRELGDSDD